MDREFEVETTSELLLKPECGHMSASVVVMQEVQPVPVGLVVRGVRSLTNITTRNCAAAAYSGKDSQPTCT